MQWCGSILCYYTIVTITLAPKNTIDITLNGHKNRYTQCTVYDHSVSSTLTEAH